MRFLALVVLTVVASMLLLATASPAATKQPAPEPVKYGLKVDAANAELIDVTLSFKLKAGEKAVLQPLATPAGAAAGQPSPVVELAPSAGTGFKVEASTDGTGDWVVSADTDTTANISYKVDLTVIDALESAPDTPQSPQSAVPISIPGLVLLEGAQVLLCPRSADGTAPLSNDYQLTVTAAAGEKVLTPWAQSGGATSFKVSSTDELLQNYLAWGKLNIQTSQRSGVSVSVALSSDYASQKTSTVDQYISDLLLLYEEAVRVLGPRPQMTRLSVLATGASSAGLQEPGAATLLESMVLFHGASKLTGEGAAATGTGLFDLWNHYSMVPAPNGQATWFQQGISIFYGMRMAAQTGLTDDKTASQELGAVYSAYLTSPLAATTSVVDAAKLNTPEAQAFVSDKGTVICACIAQRLWDESGGAKDMDWFVGQVAKRFNHFEGKDYTQVDLEEMLEEATGKSWARFFSEKVQGTTTINASEFTSSSVLGGENSTGGRKLVVKGSGRSWIFIVVAVLIIFSIPIIFGTYVRRSIKLDVQMPKILPDDDFENLDAPEAPRWSMGDEAEGEEGNAKALPEHEEEILESPEGPAEPEKPEEPA